MLAGKLAGEGERSVAVLRQAMVDLIGEVDGAKIDYIEIVEDASLAAVDEVRGDVLVALAVEFGATRLIDNTVLNL